MVTSTSGPQDKAGHDYWEGVWAGGITPDPIAPNAPGLNNFVNRSIHRSFAHLLEPEGTAGKFAIEVGCAASSWLPYFRREFGYEVTGLDYSELGCRQAEAVLRRSATPGRVVCADLFSPPPELLNRFDLAYSLGVVEHFGDTVAAISAVSRLVKPGGHVLTVIPNMTGIPGALQRGLNREVYNLHVPLTCRELAQSHQAAGLQVLASKPMLFLNLGVVNVENLSPGISYVVATRLRSWFSKAVWVAESALAPLPPNEMTSPFFLCFARAPGPREGSVPARQSSLEQSG